ncbi:MAG: TIGR00282 family metallophosphoesterase [Thermovirgaceae bacterium]
MKILFVGDIMGKPGRKIVRNLLPEINKDFGPFDFKIANAENAAGGFGLTEKVMYELFGMGFDCLTSGNHIWDKKEFLPVLDGEKRVLRPANYPPGCQGIGQAVFPAGGAKIAVLNLQGRVFMTPIDCPFRKADEILEKLDKPVVIVDFHAEATSEKKALGLYLDGRVSCVIGTHTHVQTADEQILPKGTAFITDVGMTGGQAGVIGMDKESVFHRFLTGTPAKFDVSRDDVSVKGLVVEIDEASGRALEVKRISMEEEPAREQGGTENGTMK